MGRRRKRVPPIVAFYVKYPPERYRCSVCKLYVQPVDERWRMGFNGWEHKCSDADPEMTWHVESERVLLRKRL